MNSLTHIKFKSKGFWIPEAFIEVLSGYVCETFEAHGLNIFSNNLQELYKICDANRRGVYVGMVNIAFDRTVSDDTDRTILIDLLHKTKSLINSKGQELSISTLNAFENRKVDDEFKSYWTYPIKTQSLTATINIIIQMLNGTWASNNYGVYYVGFPNPTREAEI